MQEPESFSTAHPRARTTLRARRGRQAAASDLITKAKLLRGFGDPSRLAILELLLGGPRMVKEIAAATGLSQPLVSMHLKCMRC